GCWRHAPRPDRCAVKGHPDFLPDFGVNLVTRLRAVNAANDHDWVMKRPFANNLPNTATAGQGNEARWAESDA
ncbi:MAG: hypothetical protein WCD60_17485, partial [Pseudolabrys sp.]